MHIKLIRRRATPIFKPQVSLTKLCRHSARGQCVDLKNDRIVRDPKYFDITSK